MLGALLMSLALGPAWNGVDPAPASSRLELVARVDETRLVLLNPGDHPQLVVLSEIAGNARAATWLAPGGEFEARFPAGTLAGLALEVVSPGPDAIRSSGALALEPLGRAGHDVVWIESGSPGSSAWGRHGDSIAALVPCEATGTLAASLPPTRAALSAPVHVPVITPADKKNGDLPPRLERKPLPIF